MRGSVAQRLEQGTHNSFETAPKPLENKGNATNADDALRKRCADLTSKYPELLEVMDAWPKLSPAIRRIILAAIRG